MLSFDPAEMPPQDRYRRMLPCVAPRPIALVSSLSPDGTPNLAPFSFFNMGGSNPVSLAFSPTNMRDGKQKDTLRNIEATGEYVIAVVTRANVAMANDCSYQYEYGVSEWAKSGFTPRPATKVKPSLVAESPANFECQLFEVVRHGEGAQSANYVIGEVVMCHFDEAVLTDGIPDTPKMDLVGRLGRSDWYSMTRPEDLFALPRPTEPK